MLIRNPRTGEMDYELSIDTPHAVKDKLEKLKKNQISWSGKTPQERAQILLQWHSAIMDRKEKIVYALAQDTGRKKISETEFNACMGLLQGWCYKAQELMKTSERRPSYIFPPVHVLQDQVPYPVVGVISPWNFPMLLAFIDAVPALMAGSAVACKPSEVTPRFIDAIEDATQSVKELDGILSWLRGGAETGKAVVDHADVICFTGSVPTGRSIARRCTERFIPAFLELGGKDAAIVLSDANIESSTDAILRSCAGASGQACQSLERIYVHERIFDVFVRMISEKALRARFLTDGEPYGEMGPIIFKKQAEVIQSHINDAVEQGALIHTGGKVENVNGGLYCAPTVMTQVHHNMKVMTEETFGPLIPIQSFSSESQAVFLANDSKYGLSASVFSSDEEKAISIAKKLNAGGISINDGSLTNKVFDAEKNSFNLSGLYGSRMGDAGFTRFFRKKALLIQTGKPETLFDQAREV